MLLFLLTLFPLSLAAYCVYRKDPKQIITIVIGILTGALVCAFNFFFKFSHRVVPYSFLLNFVYYIGKMGIVTVAVIYGLFLLLSRDTFEDKISYFDTLMLSCYAIFVPFYVITGTESSVYSGFSIFIKPLVYLAMIFTTGELLKQFYNSVKNKKPAFAVMYVAFIICTLLIPSVIDSWYAINFPFAIVMIVSVLYILVPAVIFVLKMIEKQKQEADVK